MWLCDCKQFTIEPAERFTQDRALYKTTSGLLSFDLDNIVLQVSIRVGHTVREENRVMIVLEVVRERQCVVKSLRIVFSHLVFEVADISAGAMPPNSALIRFFLRVDRNFHAIVKH